jgi:hypothetical protein
MKLRYVVSALSLVALPALASAEAWKNVSLVDTMCVGKVKADPDKHPAACALKCAESGFGVLTSDGSFLKLDAQGNTMATAALKATKKTNAIRATVEGDRDGETIKVKSLTLD